MGKRILLADDSVTIQKVVELTFMDEDYEVVAVSNGDDAVARLREVEPDIVIADVHMPGASGYEVCERVKQWRPRTPVLLLVGTFEPFQEAEAQRVGADSYLKKPFDSQELLHRTQELTLAAEREPAPVIIGTPADEMELWQSAEPEAQQEAGVLYPDELGGDSPVDPLAAQHLPDELELEASPWTEAEEPGGQPAWPPVAAPEPAAAPPAPPPEPSYATTAAASPASTVLASTVAARAAAYAAPVPPPATPAASGGAASSGSAASGSAASGSAASGGAAVNGGLSEADVDRIARRVVELIGDRLVREVAWEVVPDMAELVIKDRLRELERQLEVP